jgi:peptidoglycan/LPS O-acetylase OafA/YrhL/lysophospholipase L1-like esterase
MSVLDRRELVTPTGVSPSRIGGLDGVRALAVVAVLVFHASAAWAPGGFAGVDVFFVVSGFLITTLLLREQETTGRLNLPAFYVRRARRLLPAAVVVVIVAGLAALAVGGDILVGLLASLFGIVTLTQNWVMLAAGNDYFAQAGTGLFDNFWSLAIEEQFYLVWPAVLALGFRSGRSPRQGWIGLAVAVSVAVPLAMVVAGYGAAAYLSTFGHLFGLLIGVWLAVALIRRTPSATTVTRIVGTTLIAVGLLAFGAVSFSDLGAAVERQTLTSLAGAAAGAALVVGCVLTTTPRPHLLDAGALGWLGRRSYGVYLWHLPLIVLADAALPALPDLGRLPGRLLAVVLSVGLAALSYRYLEEPIRRRGFLATVVRPWPGRLAGVTAVLLLAAVAAGTALLAPAQTSVAALIAAQTSAEASPVGADLISAPMVAVGDSVMLASKRALQESFPQVSVDAQENRQLTKAAGEVTAVLGTHPQARVVVIGLGINGVGSSQDLEQAVAASGDRVVVLVNVSGPVAWADSVNRAIVEVAANHPRVVVADWRSQARAHPDLLASDGVHPGYPGSQLYARSIADALRSYRP